MNIIVNSTTAIAAINTNRNYIGFELDKHYCDIANKRVQKAMRDKGVEQIHRFLTWMRTGE